MAATRTGRRAPGAGVRRRRAAVSPEQHPPPVWTPAEEQDDFLKVVLYGDPGTGKTTALAALARLGKILFVNAESGLKTTPLRRLGIPVDAEHLQKTYIRSFADAEALIWDLRRRFDADPACLIGVVVDSITEIEKVFMEEENRATVRRAAARGQRVDLFEVDDDWTRNNAKMRVLIRGLRDLPCHVGFSALSRRDQDEEGVVFYKPALGPKISNELVAHCDISLAMQPPVEDGRQETFWGICRRQGKWSGKDRLHILPAHMPNPSMDRLVAYLRGDLTAKSDPEARAFRQYRAALKKEA